MHDDRSLRGTAAVVLSAALIAAPLPAAGQADFTGCQSNPNSPFIDNRDGYFVNYEEAPNHPLELSFNGRRLYATSIPDARVGVFDVSAPGAPVLIREIAVGLGPVTVRRRPEQTILQQPVPPLPGSPASADPLAATGAPAPVAAHGAPAQAIEIEPAVVRHLWVVCMSSNSLFIIDEMTLRVIDSVHLPSLPGALGSSDRPSGLVFDADGDFAYVTLSDSNRIVRINANNPHAAPVYYEFESEMPLGTGNTAHAEEPRALLLDGDDLYVASFLSGNGTTLKPGGVITADIENQWNFPAGNPAPPDRDVLHFDVSAATPQGSAALWRMGAINFHLGRGGPQNHLYVTGMDFRNEDEINMGEPQYRINSTDPANSFVVHQIAHAAPSVTGTPQTGTVVVDLNDPAHHAATLHSAFKCAQPNQFVFAGSTAFIACNETRNVAMFNANTDQVVADFAVAPTSARGFGIRGVALSSNGRWLYAYGRGDNSLLVFDTQGLSAGSPKRPSRILSIGFDITTPRILAGRFHFLDASNSASGLTTCNTCHVDGHLDGVAWNLSDFTGDVASDPLNFPRVPKGAKTTLSLLGIEETPPFHWRGDRADLEAFDPAFEGLLGGTRLDDPQDPSDTEFEEFSAFVFSLSYPPNPNQELDRGYTLDAETGFDCFSMEPAHDVTKDTTGMPPNPPATGLLHPTCEECHSMAGASATLNQINNPIIGLLADDATQLRGLWDKTSDTVDFDPLCASLPTSEYCLSNQLKRLPATGWGLANTGFVDSLIDFINLGVFSGLPSGSQPKIERFVLEMDTGSAPTTGASHQITGSLVAPYPSPAQEMLDGAALGHNDLVVRGWITHNGSPRSIGMLYDPFATGGPAFTTDTIDDPQAGCTVDDTLITPGANAIGPFTLAQLGSMVAARQAVLTLIGTPVGSGYRFGLDREMDCLRDGDEATHGASSATAHSDTDGFPDGYEVRLGSDPTLASSTPTDTVDPGIPSGVVSWFNSNVLKARWRTDEESKSRIRIFDVTSGSPGPLVYENDEEQFKRYHVMVARNLEPERTYEVEVEAEDPSGRTSTKTLGTTHTTQNHLFDSVHLASTTLTHLGTNPNGTEQYQLDFHVVDEHGGNVQGAEVVGGILEWNENLNNLVATVPASFPVSGANGVASVTFNGQLDFTGQPGVTEGVAIDVTFVNTLADVRLYFHSLDGQCGHWNQIGLYGGTPADPCQ